MGSCISNTLTINNDSHYRPRPSRLDKRKSRQRRNKRRMHNNKIFCINCSSNNIAGVIRGFSHSININKLSIHGYNPLHYAIKNNHIDLANTLVKGENKGHTIFHACVMYNNIELLSMLLEKL